MSAPVAVIPARDEAARIAAAVTPLVAAGLRVVVVANGCADETAARARAAGAAVIETGVLPGGVGEARRVGMAAALEGMPDWVMTTDADCVVARASLAAVARRLRVADAVFGRVEPDPGGFAALPARVRRHGMLEDRRDALRAWIEGLRAAEPWNPAPCHGQSPGALIALRPSAYRAVGGFAPVRCHEDRMIASALARAGLRVARPWDAVVRASCRLDGRAPGGMADTIGARAAASFRATLAAETRALRRECRDLRHVLETMLGSGAPSAAGVADPSPLTSVPDGTIGLAN